MFPSFGQNFQLRCLFDLIQKIMATQQRTLAKSRRNNIAALIALLNP